LALALCGTTEAPHFHRIALRVARIYIALAADGRMGPEVRSREIH
jgi:hypothetical protein